MFSSCSKQNSLIIIRIMNQSHLRDSRNFDLCTNSLLQTTNPHANFSFPEVALESSMSKHEKSARERLELAQVVEQISSTIHEIIGKLLHERIYEEITKIINEVLCIREEVTSFSKEGSIKQEEINKQFKVEIRRLRKKVDEITSKSNNLSFNTFLKQTAMGRDKSVIQGRNQQGVEEIIKDVYDFIRKNESTALFRDCQLKIQKMEESFKQQKASIAEMVQELKRKQKPINESLRKQLNDALSKDTISKEVKRCIKENIKYLFDQLVRSRKEIEHFKEQLGKLSERQRELQFSQTLLQHKLA